MLKTFGLFKKMWRAMSAELRGFSNSPLITHNSQAETKTYTYNHITFIENNDALQPPSFLFKNNLTHTTSLKFHFMQTKFRFWLMTVSVTALSLVSSFVNAQTTTATLTSDQQDYAPGSVATLTGTGFTPGETVTLQVIHVGEDPDGTDPQYHEPWTVVADENGNFVTTWNVPVDGDALGASFKATADGQSSGLHAETFFTDANDLNIFASNCTTAKTTFCLGETVCIKASTINGGSHHIEWFSPFNSTTPVHTSTSSSTSITDSYIPTEGGTWTVKLIKESNGNSDNTQTFIVVTAPTIGNPGPNATIECTATPSFTAPTASDACSGATVNIVSTTTAAGSCTGNYNVTRSWDATDASGNHSATVSQTITVQDTQAPSINAPADATIECTATPTFGTPTASDACSGASVQQVGSDVTTPGSCAGTYSITRTWRAVDNCGNSSGTVAQTITVQDTQAPSINAPANTTIECTATPTFGAPTASDACSGATVNTLGADVTGGTACAQTVTRTWYAVDACNNTSATRSQTITIVDTQAPVISAAGADATIECTASPSFTAPTASDACHTSTVNIVGSDVTGGTVCARTVTRTWNAVDACGNTSATRSQTITIVDTQAPTITGVSVSQTCLWPPNHKMRDVTVNYTLGTDCSAVTSALSVSSNEPVNGTGDGNTSPDWAVLDDHHLQLRAEREGNGTGRIYTITITVTDACGNSSSTTTQVMVAHNIYGPANANASKVGSTVNFGGTFWDVTGNKHTAKWLLDGNAVATGTLTEPSGMKNGNVTGSYKFTAPGIYKLQLNITDQKGAISYVNTNGDLQALVVIYDPNGGYTYGSGSFTSPAGSVPSNPSATPKISFGFQSNYYKGATNPKGETEFDFDAGDFQFNALNFDYLVVDGAKAQFKGSGKISDNNGTIQSGINFIMTVIDGKLAGGVVDKIHMKIYNKNTGQIYYDNQPNATSDADDPTTTADGDITIVNPNMIVGTTTTTMARANTTEETKQVADKLSVVVYPNPSENQFMLKIESDNLKDKISVRVMDMYGRTVQIFTNLSAGQILHIGSNYKTGVYFIDMIQGDKHKQLKLIKQ
ncbi:MAG TPA: T9SS type A sorting domain-containing protein [Chitinophagaceae bacterium]|nr:T9SS type A sorting domain-containing protein [Chitinophagaceae bacterium]